MDKKKIISLTTASILVSNFLPITQLQVFADEVKEDVITQDVENLESISRSISTRESAIRTLSTKVKVNNINYGSVINERDNSNLGEGESSIVLKTYYDNYEESGKWIKTYTGNISSQDEKVNLKVTAKSGYIATLVPNLVTSGTKYLDYDAKNLVTSNTSIGINPINTTKWGPGSGTTELSADLNTEMIINFSAKLDAQKITTEIIGNGTITEPEELYYANNEALIDKNTTHTFKINPGKNQEVTATLNGEPLEISEDNTITIGAGHLKVEFTEAVQTDKYNLNLNIDENGKINIENKDYSGQTSALVSKEYETTLIAKPDNGYYTSKVTLDGEVILPNEDGSYTLPTTELEDRELQVIFEEKMNATIIVDENRLPYTGEEQQLTYIVEGQDKEVLTTGKVKFYKKNGLGQTVYYNPVEIGNHKYKATFDGNEKYNACTLEGTLEIYDNRQEVTIEFPEITKVYNGEVQTIVANVVSEDKEVVATVDAEYDFKAEHLLNPAGKDVGTYDVTAKFKGDKNYKAAEGRATIEITKCKPKVSVGNKTATYNGKAIRSDVVITPKCGYIGLYTGVNTKLSPIVYVDVNLGDDAISKKISEFINSMDIGTAGELKKIFENEALLKLLELAKIDVSDITNALKYLPDDMALSFGAPVNAGAYVSTAIVIDKNAEVAVGIGGLLVTKSNRNIVFTEDSLGSGDKIKPGQEYKMEAVFEGTNEKVEVKFTGLTTGGKTYSSTQAPKEVGVYVATAFVGSDSNYRADIAVRSFTIAKSTTSIKITSSANKVYDGKAYEVESTVKDRDGKVVEGSTVKYTYYKGLRKLSSAPTEAGSYRVIATYSGDDAHYGSTTSMKFSISK